MLIDKWIKRAWCLWHFLNKRFKFQPGICNGCHDALTMHMNLRNIAILNICSGDYCIFTIVVIITTIIIELTHSKTILENTVEIEPQPVALDFKNLSRYSSRSK